MGTVIASLVGDVIMPIVGAIGGAPDFSAIKLGPILFGKFLNALIAFLVLAWVVFMLVKAVNTARKQFEKPAAPAAPPAPPRSEVLLEEIRNALVKGR
jgi:large conductance mechanosensitive channel